MAHRRSLAPLALLLLLVTAACHRAPKDEPKEAPDRGAPAPPVVRTLPIERETEARESGSLVLARIGEARVAFVADEDDAAIVEIDATDGSKPPRSTAIGSRPRDLLLLGDGTIAATLPDANAIAVFAREETGALREVRRAKTPVERLAMALGPKDDELFVTTGTSHTLVAFAPSSLEETARWSLAREPRAALVSKDGARIFVTHAAESVLAIVEKGTKDVVTKKIGNGNGCFTDGGCTKERFARHANALVRMGDGIVIPTAQTLPQPPISFFPRKHGPMHPFDDGLMGFKMGGRPMGVTGYGVGDGTSGPPVFMDLVTYDEKEMSRMSNGGIPMFEGSKCLLPRAAVAVGDEVFVACLGTDRIEQFKNPKGRSALHSAKGSVTVPRGPTGLAGDRDGKHVFVWSAFARVLSSYAANATDAKLAQAKKLAKSPSSVITEHVGTTPVLTANVPRLVAKDEAWLTGRDLFFRNTDPRISKDGRACASCHVDGRDDGLTWDTPNGPRRTRVIAGQLATAPYGWKGEHPTLEAHVTITFKQLGGKGLPEDELAALLTYVKALPKPPVRNDADHARGKELFASAECGNCHGNGAGDRSVHDVGTGGTFMTPTLAGIGTKKQLMHDGRYATLDELLVGATKMGTASTLPPEDRKALVGYLETL